MGIKDQSRLDEPADVLGVAAGLVPLCSLKPQYLEFLLQESVVNYYCAGDVLFERGWSDQRHIYLLHGQAVLQFASGYKELISAGDAVYPLANEMPRPCDGICKTDCAVLMLDSDHLDRILSWSQIAQYLVVELSMRRDGLEDLSWMETVIESNLFYKVPPVNAARILPRMQPLSVRAGETVVRQGEVGHCCYFIKEGSAEVVQFQQGGKTTRLAELERGRCFGEDALVYETLRNATVVMLSDGQLMRLEKDDFKLLLLEPEVNEIGEESIHGLTGSPVFIDVRTQSEYDEGHLAMAANVPLNILCLKQRLLRNNIPYIFYCDTGRRSRAAAYLLAQQGFTTMALRGGLLGAGMQYQLIRDEAYLLKDGGIQKSA